MRILINLENTDNIVELYVEPTDTIENLKYIIEAEMNIPFNQQQLKFQDNLLNNDKTPLIGYNILEDDVVIVGKVQPKPQMNLGNTNLSQIFDNTMKMINNQGDNSFKLSVKMECAKIKYTYLNNPGDLSVLFSTDTELAEALVSENDAILEELVAQRIKKYDEKKKKEKDEYDKLMRADSNDAEAQKKIAELIKWKNIEENLSMAHEYLPETFSHIHMLYIDLEINKHKITALVDTGAQSTIISQDLAEKCGLFNLCDTRYAGIAKGVGTSKILGVIHAAQIKLGDRYIYFNLDLLCARLQS